jgi:hypothetical protein
MLDSSSMTSTPPRNWAPATGLSTNAVQAVEEGDSLTVVEV